MSAPPILAKTNAVTDASVQRARWLLRGLLRQASYLPDDAARAFVHHRVLHRFRQHSRHSKTLTESRLASLFRTGDYQLRSLRRANDGEHGVLVKILRHTYARTGKRRRELMARIATATELQDGEVGNATGPPAPGSVKGIPPIPLPKGVVGPFHDKADLLRFEISPEHSLLRELVRAQAKHEGTKEAKTLQTTMDAKNIWDRAMPRKRQVNFAAKWWALVLEKVVVPLPVDEWERLHGLATGVIPWAGPSKRRAILDRSAPINSVDMLQQAIKFGAVDQLSAREHLRHNVEKDLVSRRHRNLKSPSITSGRGSLLKTDGPAVRGGQLFASTDTALTGIEQMLEDQLEIKYMKKTMPSGKDTGRVLTARTMRRLWAGVLQDTPCVTWDVVNSTWKVHWHDPHGATRAIAALDLLESRDEDVNVSVEG